jgi:molybdopterin converting factor small subunit
MGILERIFGKEVDIRKEDRQIKVRFPSMVGDESRMMTVQQLKKEYKDYLIFDPQVGEQVDLEKLANLENINEVVVIPPISGGI